MILDNVSINAARVGLYGYDTLETAATSSFCGEYVVVESTDVSHSGSVCASAIKLGSPFNTPSAVGVLEAVVYNSEAPSEVYFNWGDSFGVYEDVILDISNGQSVQNSGDGVQVYFEQAGDYTALGRLQTPGGEGLTNQVSFSLSQAGQPPVAAVYEVTSSLVVPGSLTLSSEYSYDPDGEIIERNWRLDGLYVGSGVIQVFTGMTSGNHFVELELVDNSSSRTIYPYHFEVVENLPPVVDFVCGSNNGKLKCDVTEKFNDDGSEIIFEWMIGSNSYSGENIIHGQYLNGIVDVTLVASDSFGAAITINKSIDFTVDGLSFEFSCRNIGESKVYCLPQIDNELAEVVTEYHWMIEDREVSSDRNALINFDVDGSYLIKLEIVTQGNQVFQSSEVFEVSALDVDYFEVPSLGTLLLSSNQVNKFHPYSTILDLQVDGASFSIAGHENDFEVYNGEELLDVELLEITGSIVKIGLNGLTDGYNELHFKFKDSDNRTLNLNQGLWAGARTISLSVMDDSGNSITDGILQVEFVDSDKFEMQIGLTEQSVKLDNVPQQDLVLAVYANNSLSLNILKSDFANQLLSISHKSIESIGESIPLSEVGHYRLNKGTFSITNDSYSHGENFITNDIIHLTPDENGYISFVGQEQIQGEMQALSLEQQLIGSEDDYMIMAGWDADSSKVLFRRSYIDKISQNKTVDNYYVDPIKELFFSKSTDSNIINTAFVAYINPEPENLFTSFIKWVLPFAYANSGGQGSKTSTTTQVRSTISDIGLLDEHKLWMYAISLGKYSKFHPSTMTESGSDGQKRKYNTVYAKIEGSNLDSVVASDVSMERQGGGRLPRLVARNLQGSSSVKIAEFRIFEEIIPENIGNIDVKISVKDVTRRPWGARKKLPVLVSLTGHDPEGCDSNYYRYLSDDCKNISTRNNGDDYIHSEYWLSVRNLLTDRADLVTKGGANVTGVPIRVADISNLNGGKFPPHAGHNRGINLDLRYSKIDEYKGFSTGAPPLKDGHSARALLDILNSSIGSSIHRLLVTVENEGFDNIRDSFKDNATDFQKAIRAECLVDGRYAGDAIVHKSGHNHHFDLGFFRTKSDNSAALSFPPKYLPVAIPDEDLVLEADSENRYQFKVRANSSIDGNYEKLLLYKDIGMDGFEIISGYDPDKPFRSVVDGHDGNFYIYSNPANVEIIMLRVSKDKYFISEDGSGVSKDDLLKLKYPFRSCRTDRFTIKSPVATSEAIDVRYTNSAGGEVEDGDKDKSFYIEFDNAKEIVAGGFSLKLSTDDRYIFTEKNLSFENERFSIRFDPSRLRLMVTPKRSMRFGVNTIDDFAGTTYFASIYPGYLAWEDINVSVCVKKHDRADYMWQDCSGGHSSFVQSVNFPGCKTDEDVMTISIKTGHEIDLPALNYQIVSSLVPETNTELGINCYSVTKANITHNLKLTACESATENAKGGFETEYSLSYGDLYHRVINNVSYVCQDKYEED